MGSWYTLSETGVTISVRVRPRSSRAGVAGVEADALKVYLKSAPVDGKANKELIDTIADFFGVAKSRVAFKSGETSKTKRLFVQGVDGTWFNGRDDLKNV